MALAVPRGVPPAGVSTVLVSLFGAGKKGLHLYRERLFDWRLELEQREEPPVSLRASTWCGYSDQGAERWSTVTPVVLDRFPKNIADAEAALRLACTRSGLPEPCEVVTHAVSRFAGVPAAGDYAPVTFHSGAPRRWHTHATLVFDRPVVGPVLLGAGRYRGYGLCRPLEARRP
jgi:CRISPR-associated protein Csb2